MVNATNNVSTAYNSIINGTNTGTSLDRGNTMGKDDFLRLLVVQLKNQDPLDPVKNEDMASQLAQFSQLEELTNIRDAVEESTQASNGVTSAVNSMLSTTLIGKQARSAPSMIQYTEGQAVDIPIDLLGEASTCSIDIFDSAGTLIRTITISNPDEGSNVVSWDGYGDFGGVNPSGVYTYTVSAKDDMGNTVANNPYIEGTVEGVNYEGSTIFFIIDGYKIPFSNIVEITGEGG